MDLVRKETSLERMFFKIVEAKNAFFRSQQKNEADLSEEEKLSIVTSLYRTNPSLFLARYVDFLDSADVKHFDTNPSTADKGQFGFYIEKLRNSSAKTSKNRVKNRRFAFMQNRLIDKTDYFSDYEMRNRQPLLYDQMIGRYQNEKESRDALHTQTACASNWSDTLLKLYDSKETSTLKQQQKTTERIMGLTVDNSSDEESASDLDDVDDDKGASLNPTRISEEEKSLMRNLFLHEMYEKFLNGEDVDFDYSQVDNNEEFDCLDVMENDEQEKYFDEDEK